MTIEPFRAIETADYAKIVLPTSFGPPPRLKWIEIASLIVDAEYQRDITRQTSVTNIRRIAAGFSWSHFTPVVVAPIGGSRFAIVDGQHRVTAAKLCGFDKVPCSVIEATRGEQAAAFRAINKNVTRLSTMQLHHAGVVAGEATACRIAEACKKASVTILRYPVPWDKIAPGETMAVTYVGAALQRFGEEPVIAALRAIVGSADGNPGCLRAQVIFGTSEVLADHPEWREKGGAPIGAFETINLPEMIEQSAASAARTRGSSITDQFESRLVTALTDYFAKRKRA
jgi:hypothetical protein